MSGSCPHQGEEEVGLEVKGRMSCCKERNGSSTHNVNINYKSYIYIQPKKIQRERAYGERRKVTREKRYPLGRPGGIL